MLIALVNINPQTIGKDSRTFEDNMLIKYRGKKLLLFMPLNSIISSPVLFFFFFFQAKFIGLAGCFASGTKPDEAT